MDSSLRRMMFFGYRSGYGQHCFVAALLAMTEVEIGSSLRASQ